MAGPIKLGNMLWRIGRVLDIERQIAWTRAAGFDGVGLHASAGTPGHWRGVAPATCGPEQREHLREAPSGFAFVEIHAPFAIELRADTLSSSLVALSPVLAFAHDLGATVVTVHAQIAGPGRRWRAAMRQLDDMAAHAHATVALEITSGFDAVAAWDLPRVGVNLDVGHMLLPPHDPPLAAWGGFAALLRTIGPKLAHLHLHDVRADVDHVEIGTGEIPFGEIAGALADIGYAGTATLEMNPDRVSPWGIRRSLKRLRQLLDDPR